MFTYCPLCGERLVGTYEIGKSYMHCPTEHYTYYPNQVVGAVAIICNKQGEILLERRAIEPGYGLWGLPGGMAEQNESIEQCITREIAEETGLQVIRTKLIDVWGGSDVCIVGYEVEVVEAVIRPSAESIEHQWYAVKDIPFAQFAFVRQEMIVRKWMDNLLLEM